MKSRKSGGIKENPRAAVVKRLLCMAELWRQQGKVTEQVEEALDWEKQLSKRLTEISKSNGHTNGKAVAA